MAGRASRVALQALDRLDWLREYARTSDGGVGALEEVPPGNGLRVDDVTFSYPGNSEEVLSQVSFAVAPGSTVALVGENGPGKTTLVKLLCGFYAPTSGRIILNGKPVSPHRDDKHTDRVSGAFQDVAQFHYLLREAVGLGDVDRMHDEKAVAGALGVACGRRMVEQLAGGLDTQLGSEFPRGVELSGGQWQRVAIARGFMRDTPDLLILDEPTSALDPTAEQELLEQFDRAARAGAQRSGAITFLISHRLSAVRNADMILVLKDGRITQRGRHAELLAQPGLYRELFTMQADAYHPTRAAE